MIFEIRKLPQFSRAGSKPILLGSSTVEHNFLLDFFGRARSKHILRGSSTVKQICLDRAWSKHTKLWSRRSKHKVSSSSRDTLILRASFSKPQSKVKKVG